MSWNMDNLIDIVKMLTENPAKLLGIYPYKGCIKPGSAADFTIIDKNFNIVYAVENRKVI